MYYVAVNVAQMSDAEAIKSRRVTSFEVDEDVAEILEKARSEGVRIGWLVNQSIRRFRPSKKASKRRDAR